MQKSIFILMLVVLGFAACQNEGGATEKANANAPTADSEMTSATNQTGEKGVNGSPFNKSETPQQEKVSRVLTTNYWVNTAYFKQSEKGANKANQGNWYQFNQDGTFTFGHFDKELAKGNWSYKDAGKVGQVHLQAEDTKYSGLWSIKIGKDEDLMIWVGTEQYRTNGVQQRLENLLFIPKNRKELGMD